MFMVAAKVLADMSPTAADKEGRLLPPVSQMRAVAAAVGKAVARQALADGVAEKSDEATLDQRIAAGVWEPLYTPYRKPG
jgi:malate dehydrogenase (oxaloacetate-decarboxylating)